jgi:hypothetical protein
MLSSERPETQTDKVSRWVVKRDASVGKPPQAPAKLPANPPPREAGNYPNPFNPETMIRFHLKKIIDPDFAS